MGCSAHPAGAELRRTSDALLSREPEAATVMQPDVAQVRRVAELIELGRDREAAVLAELGDDLSRIPGGQMDAHSQLAELSPLLMGVVGGISPDQLDNPTPCAKFTVRGVLEHMIGGATVFAAGFRAVEPGTPDTTDVLAAFGRALSELAASINSDGAFERTIQAPFGTTPGASFARYVVLDGLVHGWDLAMATGQAYEPSDALVGAVEAYAREAVPPMRDGDTFAEAVSPAASASPIERLAAFTGREV